MKRLRKGEGSGEDRSVERSCRESKELSIRPPLLAADSLLSTVGRQ